MVACGNIAILCYEIAERNLNWVEEDFQKFESLRCYKMLHKQTIVLGQWNIFKKMKMLQKNHGT